MVDVKDWLLLILLCPLMAAGFVAGLIFIGLHTGWQLAVRINEL